MTYSNEAKHEMIGVDEQTLIKYGAVSEEVVLEMAKGALDAQMPILLFLSVVLQALVEVVKKNQWA